MCHVSAGNDYSTMNDVITIIDETTVIYLRVLRHTFDDIIDIYSYRQISFKICVLSFMDAPFINILVMSGPGGSDLHGFD
jgi:hypothetical protein